MSSRDRAFLTSPKFVVVILAALGFGSAVLLAQTTAPNATTKAAADDEEEAVRITDNNILFYYEANADIPSSPESLARSYSADYRNAPSELARADLLKKLTPVIERKVIEAKKTKQIMVQIAYTLPQYDLSRKGFSTTISTETYVPFDVNGGAYAVSFKGLKNFTFLSLPEEEARKLESKTVGGRGGRGPGRSGSVQIYGTVASAEEMSLRNGTRKTVVMQVQRLVLVLDDDTVVGEIKAPTK